MMIGNWHYTPALTVRTWDAMMVNSPSLVKPLVPTDIWAPHVITSWNEHAAHWVMVLTISLLGPYTPPVLNPMPLLRIWHSLNKPARLPRPSARTTHVQPLLRSAASPLKTYRSEE